jgi:hypothetical protein
MTPLTDKLDPEAIFARGFITREEAESVELKDFAHKVQLDADGDIENIWIALLTQEDKDLYNNDDSKGEEIKGILLNHALCFYPNPTWGRMVVGKTNRTDRPIFLAGDQVERLETTHAAYMEETDRAEKEMGGQPEEDNIQAVCSSCAKQKIEYKE